MTAAQPITRDDLERKFRDLQGSTDDATESAKSYVLAAAVGVGVVVVALAFFAGRRRGKAKQTVVEIRRI